jgi:hypothetical protein
MGKAFGCFHARSHPQHSLRDACATGFRFTGFWGWGGCPIKAECLSIICLPLFPHPAHVSCLGYPFTNSRKPRPPPSSCTLRRERSSHTQLAKTS